MVLTDDNFASIQKSVEEGRGIYANIKNTVLYILSTNIAEVLAMFIVVLMSVFLNNSLPTPLIAIHILWVNLITDSLPAVALGADEKEDGIMDDMPRNPKESLFSNGGYWITFGFGLLITITTVFAFLMIPMIEYQRYSLEAIADILNPNSPNFNADVLAMSQTSAFCVLAISELFHMLGMTSFKKSFVHNFKTKNKLIWIAFIVGIALQFAVVEIPGVNTFFSTYTLDFVHWLYVILLSMAPLVLHEIIVLIRLLKKKAQNKRPQAQ